MHVHKLWLSTFIEFIATTVKTQNDDTYCMIQGNDECTHIITYGLQLEAGVARPGANNIIGYNTIDTIGYGLILVKADSDSRPRPQGFPNYFAALDIGLQILASYGVSG